MCPSQVQRPVNESTLELDLTLDALMSDTLNTNNLYVVKLHPSTAQRINISANVNGHKLDTKWSGGVDRWPPADVNGCSSESFEAKQPSTKNSKLSEETLTETFSRFGAVDRIVLPAKPGKHERRACIRE